jgi:hypothetical protein
VESNNLSMGGRLVHIKSILSSLPVYFLSFFKQSTCIIYFIESLFNFFFLCVCAVFSIKEHGGLGGEEA